MTVHSKMSALAAVLVLLLAGSARAQAVGGDADGDGVADAIDQCPDTPAGDLVDATGCSVCPCDGPTDGATWTSHQDYVVCVVTAAKARRASGQLTRAKARAAMRQAKRATCGAADLTRCCVFPPDSDADVVVGSCKVMSVDKCSQLEGDPDLDDEDYGPGSCQPNPCSY
jgi:hypothetical protein